MPGFVQNCPTPKVADPANPDTKLSISLGFIPGIIKIGLILLISANTGMGSSRAFAKSNKARPPLLDPVNPTALIDLFLTRLCPTVLPSPKSREKAPSGQLHFFKVATTTFPIRRAVPG